MNQHTAARRRARGPLVVGALCVLAAGCARDVVAHYPAALGRDTGQIEIALTEAAVHVNVSIDGNLVASDRHTRRLVIDSVPPGPHQVKIAMGGSGYTPTNHTADVFVEPGERASVVAAAPEISTASSIRIGAIYVGEMIGLSALALLL
jgi:hypothetical protein